MCLRPGERWDGFRAAHKSVRELHRLRRRELGGARSDHARHKCRPVQQSVIHFEEGFQQSDLLPGFIELCDLRLNDTSPEFLTATSYTTVSSSTMSSSATTTSTDLLSASAQSSATTSAPGQARSSSSASPASTATQSGSSCSISGLLSYSTSTDLLQRRRDRLRRAPPPLSWRPSPGAPPHCS